MKQFYEKYWSGMDGHLSDFDLKWPKISKYIPTEEGVIVLDFGCGAGEIIAEMQKINPDAKYIGVDVSQNALDVARDRVFEVELHKIEDGGRIPVKDESVDFIFSSEVIEHVYDTENAASEMARVLKPGGRALVTTPYHGLVKNLLITLLNFEKHFNPTGAHVRFFTKRTLFDLFEKQGLRVVKHGYYGRFWPIPHSIFVEVEKK